MLCWVCKGQKVLPGEQASGIKFATCTLCKGEGEVESEKHCPKCGSPGDGSCCKSEAKPQSYSYCSYTPNPNRGSWVLKGNDWYRDGVKVDPKEEDNYPAWWGVC